MTTTSGSLGPSMYIDKSSGCPNRAVFDVNHGVAGRTTSFTATLDLACEASSQVQLQVSNAQGAGYNIEQGSLTLPVDAACATAACEWRAPACTGGAVGGGYLRCCHLQRSCRLWV